MTIDEALDITCPIPVIGDEPSWAVAPTRRGRRLAARAMARADTRGPRTGEFEISDAVRRARLAAGLPAELPDTARWRWRWLRSAEWRLSDIVVYRHEQGTGGRNRGG